MTVLLDPVAQDRFDAQRRELFPAGRTEVGAHVTLFHAVPGEWRDAVAADLDEVAARPEFEVRVTEVQPLGRGAAYRLSAGELAAVHCTLRSRWEQALTPQDRQPYRPHVTVQNKVTPEEARATVARLRAGFVPFGVRAVGLALWRYDGGPWTELSRHPFRPGPR